MNIQVLAIYIYNRSGVGLESGVRLKTAASPPTASTESRQWGSIRPKNIYERWSGWLQLVPPYLHRRNAAELSMRTFKDHFIVGLCITDKNFPIHLWDWLILQATTTLNLLHISYINPHIFSEAQLNGPFHFIQMPLPPHLPPRTKVIVYSKPSNWRTWDYHGLDGW